MAFLGSVTFCAVCTHRKPAEVESPARTMPVPHTVRRESAVHRGEVRGQCAVWAVRCVWVVRCVCGLESIPVRSLIDSSTPKKGRSGLSVKEMSVPTKVPVAAPIETWGGITCKAQGQQCTEGRCMVWGSALGVGSDRHREHRIPAEVGVVGGGQAERLVDDAADAQPGEEGEAGDGAAAERRLGEVAAGGVVEEVDGGLRRWRGGGEGGWVEGCAREPLGNGRRAWGGSAPARRCPSRRRR